MRAATRRTISRAGIPTVLVLLVAMALLVPSRTAVASSAVPTQVATPSPTPQPVLPPGPSPYLLPYPGGTSYSVVQGNHGSYSHRGFEEYALDFAMPLGSLVVSSRAGRVAFVEQDSNVGGPSFKEFAAKGNVIVVDHGDGTSAVYLHLLYHGSL